MTPRPIMGRGASVFFEEVPMICQLSVKRVFRIGALVFLLMGLLSGCVTTKDGDFMKQSIIATETRLDGLQETVSNSNEEKGKSIKKIERKLDSLLETSQLTTASGHAALDRIKRDLRMINGMSEKNGYSIQQTHMELMKLLSALEKRISGLEARLGIESPTKSKGGSSGTTQAPQELRKPEQKLPASDDPAEFYKIGKEMLTKEKNSIASRRLLAQFLKKHPKNSLADNARYWIGESYYAEKNYHQAVMEFQKVVDTYQKGDAVDDSLFMLGESFRQLGMKEDAVLFYEECIERFPKTGSAGKSGKALKTLRR